MVELLVAMTLLTLIVFALMAVFSSTQTAFRAGVTQTDVLETSRAAMEMMINDLRSMTPSDGNYITNGTVNNANFYPGTMVSTNSVNFFVLDNSYAGCAYYNGGLQYEPLPQSLPGSSMQRTNVLNYFFLIGRQNMKWTAVGYVVNATNTAPLYPLYRFYAETNIAIPPVTLYWTFLNMVNQSQWTNMSHVIDGVVGLTARPYDTAGYWMTNTAQVVIRRFPIAITNYHDNVWFVPFPPSPIAGEVGCMFYSNAVPAAVELQMAVLEDRTLQRAESLGNGQPPSPNNDLAQWKYLEGQSGHVHLFRQRVTIPNVDTTAYQ